MQGEPVSVVYPTSVAPTENYVVVQPKTYEALAKAGENEMTLLITVGILVAALVFVMAAMWLVTNKNKNTTIHQNRDKLTGRFYK